MSVYSHYLQSDSWTRIFVYTSGSAIIYGVWMVLNRFLIAPLLSPLRDLPGPPNPSLLYGNLREIFKAEAGEVHRKWAEEYGPTLVYKGPLGITRFMTLDTKALAYILHHPYDWPKPPDLRTDLAWLLGKGVLFAEGDSHRHQRRIMNPSFAHSYIRDLTGIFNEKSLQLRDIWFTQAAENGGSYQANLFAWLSKATLDIIGLAGFDYQFNALNVHGAENELNSAFMTRVNQSQRSTVLDFLRAYIPLLQLIPTAQSQSMAVAMQVMNRIGRKLVDDEKKAIAQGKYSPGEAHIEEKSITTRDLLSRLMAANLATDLRDDQRLLDEDLLAQIPTFLAAGHETTAISTTWCLYVLCRDPNVQNTLRDELLSVGTDTPSMDELNSLPYLDAVTRETLRLHAPVPATIRVAMKDDIVPLSIPVKDRKGGLRSEIRVKKGVLIPILLLNTYKAIWGEDAGEFRPERWRHGTEKAAELPGVFGGLMTFLGGPRSCIGYRFALVEFKCLIFALVRAFRFEFSDPTFVILKKTHLVTRPFVKSKIEEGAQLPLKITPWKGT